MKPGTVLRRDFGGVTFTFLGEKNGLDWWQVSATAWDKHGTNADYFIPEPRADLERRGYREVGAGNAVPGPWPLWRKRAEP